MKHAEIIKQIIMEGRDTLNEAQARQLLEDFGIPVVDAQIFASIDELKRSSAHVRYPAVLKGLGSRLTHKTERGLVILNIKNEKELLDSAGKIREAAAQDLEGFLLQPMLAGEREFVAGLFFDAEFGPVIMFGLGGIFTEALQDVVFRLAPISEKQAISMIYSICGQKLLGAFRGQSPVDINALVRVLTGLSDIAATVPQIKEIDINPLLVSSDGKVTAVDALAILGKSKPDRLAQIPVAPRYIGNFIYPRSIAFIGASAEVSKWGQLMFSNVIAGNYKGEVYLVNPRGGEISGRQVYRSITDIDGSVDLAVITIPAAKVLQVMEDVKKKNVTNVLLISSGFGEIGPEGKRLENELVAQARESGILILGPNTMGICNPHVSLYCTGTHVRPKPGGTALVAQSGNLGTQLLAFAEKEGIGIRAFAGTGNEAMITIEDFMEGFEIDDLTKTVVLYIESVKNGKRFYQAAKRVGLKKPVIALKGGRTEAGAIAAASHTGAMASNVRVFEAACAQAGIVRADQPMDLLDLSAAFSSLPLPRGNRVAILTLGGGWGVVASDLCNENGLVVQPLAEGIINKINKWLPPYWSHANPVDLVAEMNTDIHVAIAEELLQWEECDAIIHMGIIGRRVMIEGALNSTLVVDKAYGQKYKEDSLELLKDYERELVARTVSVMEKYHKPVIGVYLLTDETTRTVIEIEGQKYKGIVFPSPERAVNVLAKMYRYARWLEEAKD